ncbi:MAG: oligopeptide/dipeptide ABC transporter ATP-binding protein [bacterium]
MTTLEVVGLTVRYGHGSTGLTAVEDVNLAIPPGGTLGLVGESGCGKSTVARAIVRLIPIASGRLLLNGQDVAAAHGAFLRDFRRRVQMVFQDPYASLNPRMTVGDAIGEAIATYRNVSAPTLALEVARLLEMVGLDPRAVTNFPHQFSGGQRQRIAIARSLAVQPEILICDEVTSSVDVSVQANILNLLKELQKTLGLSYLFISHNLSVIRYMSDAVSVMYLGRVVEHAPAVELFARPRHPYTRVLIDSIPKVVSRVAADRVHLSGDVPDPRDPPPGCRFHTRCPFGPLVHPDRVICRDIDPHTTVDAGAPMAACHFPLSGDVAGTSAAHGARP